MPHISKYQFGTDFAEPESSRVKSSAEEEEEAEPPMFSEAELLAAREHGYEAGIAAGQAQAVAGIEKHVSEIIANIDNQLGAVSQEIAGQVALAVKDVAILAGAIAAKVTGTESDQARLDLLERMITDCMSKLYRAPEVTARVPADIEEELRSRLTVSEFAINVNVIPDQALTGTDCRLSWQGGGGERVEARIWQEVEALLERYVAGEPGEAPADNAGTDAAQTADHIAEAAQEAPQADSERQTDDAAAAEDAADAADAAELALHVTGAPTQPAPPLEQDGGQSERPAPGDLDG